MGIIFTVPLNEIRMSPELKDTNLITFPVNIMREFHMVVGNNVVLQLSRERLLLTIGIPLGNISSTEVVNLDPTYEFIRGEEGGEWVKFEKLDSRHRFPHQKVILLFNRENSLRRVVEWLKNRPAVNTNVVYSIDENTRCMFAQAYFQKVTAIVPLFDAYYVVNEFQECRELWQEVCTLQRKEQKLRRTLTHLNAQIDRSQRENKQYKHQLKKMLEQCELEKTRFEGLLSLEGVNFLDIAQNIQKLSDTLKTLTENGENKYFSADDVPEMPFVEEELTFLVEAMEKARKLLDASKAPEDGFEKSRSIRLAAELGNPPPLTGKLEDYRERLNQRKKEISEEVKRLQGRLKEIQENQRQFREAITNLNREEKRLTKRIKKQIPKLEKEISRLQTLGLPETNFLVQRIKTMQEQLNKLFTSSERENINQLTLELWKEFQHIHIGMQRLEEDIKEQQGDHLRRGFDI